MKNHRNLSILKKETLIFSILLFTFLLFSNHSLFAQQNDATNISQENITIKGTVYSEFDNEPLQGTSITVKNTIRGVETDENGNFQIKNLKEGDVLAFYYTSFKTQEIKVKKDRFFLKVYMQEDTNILDPIVLVGDVDVKTTFKTKRSLWKRIASIF